MNALQFRLLKDLFMLVISNRKLASYCSISFLVIDPRDTKIFDII
jgi:hypothetical protein